MTEISMSNPKTDLATLDNIGEIPLRERIAIARKSGLIPPAVRTDEAAALILIKAHEFGVPWTQAFSAFHVINGVCSCGSQFMLAKAYERLPEFGFEMFETDSDKCRARMRRSPKHAWMEISYTFKQAQQAGLASKANWKNHPDDMLRARVISKLLKVVAPDVYMGIYTEDEAEEIKSIPHAEVTEATAARRVHAKLMGEPPHAPPDPAPPPEAPPPEDPPGDVVDVEAPPEDGATVPATADWESAIDQVDCEEALGLCLAQLAIDDRLSAEDRRALRDRAAAIAQEKQFAAGAWRELVISCTSREELDQRYEQLKPIGKALDGAARASLKSAMQKRAGELAAVENGGPEGSE